MQALELTGAVVAVEALDDLARRVPQSRLGFAASAAAGRIAEAGVKR